MELNHKRIVVTFLMHLGDVILTTPFMYVLRQAAPDSHITYVMDEKLKDVMLYNPYIDEIITVDKKGKDNGIGALYHIARNIHCKVQPDVVINLHPNERTSFLAWAISAKKTVGMSHFLFRPWMTTYTRLDRRTRHAADMYINVLEQLKVPIVPNKGLQIFSCPQWQSTVDDLYEAQGVSASDTLVGFNVGSAVPEKRWPKERFAAIADTLADEGYVPVFFGGPMDEEMVSEVVAGMSHTPIVMTGRLGLGELAEAIKRCRLFITNDSGPMHVAVSQQVPVVALYGPSNPKFYGPYTTKCIVLESMTDYEIGKSMKQIIREGKYKGLGVISEETVLEAAHTLLQKQE